MAGFQCPYCSMIMPECSNTSRQQFPSFEQPVGYTNFSSGMKFDESCVSVNFYKCPNCLEYSISIQGKGSKVKKIDTMIKPNSTAKPYPDYIPQAIRNDYEEACAIVDLSPKASATLSRRCLQGMIHDFWNIKLKNLNQEITTLKEFISADLWQVIDGLRELGNIGAHMEKDINLIIDIDENEARYLIQFIELLMKEWYINRHDRNNLLSSIITTNTSKQELRKKTE